MGFWEGGLVFVFWFSGCLGRFEGCDVLKTTTPPAEATDEAFFGPYVGVRQVALSS